MSDLRREILDRARHLMVEDGYAHLSMRKIAAAVGCSATSIYLHFESKDALVHALIDEGFERLNARLQEAAEAHADPAERLGALARAYIRFGLENPEYYEVMFLLHPERMARYPVESYRRARRNLELIAEALEAGAADGTRAAAPTDVAAHVHWAAMHGVVSLLLARRVDVRVPEEAIVEAAVRYATEGLRTASVG
ncbi:MAG TPA: TetR/AcrR family transcriptional regulator [Rhodothermales bacterium]|nr:TetR/AcrR family transcriptional regulator [Rhodothermales bacterium]